MQIKNFLQQNKNAFKDFFKGSINRFFIILLLFSILIGASTIGGITSEKQGNISRAENTLPVCTIQATNTNKSEKTTHVFLIKEGSPIVPKYFQGDYPHVPYGAYGSIASHGCGITCLAMVATYLSDEVYTPPQLAKRYGHYNTARGSYWSLFEDTADDLNINFQEQTDNTNKVIKALKNGQVVVALQGTGLFTNEGHFILLTGITSDGRITVNDPNNGNYTKNETLSYGFKHGFTQNQIFENGGPYWIYEKK